jgi:hypothetical protein
MTIIDTPEGIAFFRLCQMQSAIKLEMKGLRHSRGSVYALAKREYNLQGNRQSVVDQLQDMIDAAIEAKRNARAH